MIPIAQPLGPFLDNNGIPLSAGAMYFLDKDTSLEKSVYLDEALTMLADNPQILSSSGCLSDQVYLGSGQYKIRLYSVADVVSPLFPDDYSLVRSWDQDGVQASTSSSALASEYSTMALFRAAAPTNGDSARLLGYYALNDCPPVTYKFDGGATGSDDGVSKIRPDGYGTGFWILEPLEMIDVRNAGCQSGSANAKIANAISAATLRGVPVYFPKGLYSVSGTAVQSLSCEIKMDTGALFTVDSGSYTIRPLSRWDIGPGTHTSTGNFILDLSSSPDFHFEGCDPNWWFSSAWGDSLNSVSLYCGTSGMMLKENITILSRSSSFVATLPRIAVSGGAFIFNPSTVYELVINNVDNAGGPMENTFRATIGRVSDYCSFGCQVRASWFTGGSDGGVSLSIIAESLLVDIDCTATQSYSASRLVPYGGVIDVGAYSCSSSGFVDSGKWIKGNGGTLVCDGRVPSASNWIIGTNGQFSSFLESCILAGVEAEFDGVSLSSVSATISNDISIHGLRGSSVSINGNGKKIQLVDCSGISVSTGEVKCAGCNDLSGISGTIYAKGCSFLNATISGSLEAVGCYFRSSPISATSIKAQGNTFLASNVICDNSSLPIDCILMANSFINSSLSIRNGAGTSISNVIVKGNAFTNAGADPIDISSLLSNSISGAFDISGNTPELLDLGSIPTSTVLKQTRFDFVGTVAAGSTTTFSYSGARWAAILPNVSPEGNAMHVSLRDGPEAAFGFVDTTAKTLSITSLGLASQQCAFSGRFYK